MAYGPDDPRLIRQRIEELSRYRTQIVNAQHEGVPAATISAELQRLGFRSLAHLDRALDSLQTQGNAALAPERADFWKRARRNALQGATLWNSDELAGLIPGGETRDEVRAQLAQDMAQHPTASRVEQGVGLLAPILATGGAGAAFAGPSLAANMIGGGLLAGGEALVGGMGMSNAPPAEAFREALPGAGVAAAAGLAMPLAAPAAAMTPYLRRVTQGVRMPGAVMRDMVRQVPGAEVSAIPEETTLLQRAASGLAPGEAGPVLPNGPLPMDTRAGQKLATMAAETDPAGAGASLVQAATNREAGVTGRLEQLLGRQPEITSQTAKTFWRRGDVSATRRWLAEAPADQAELFKDALVHQLAREVENAPDKIAFLTRTMATSREKLQMVLSPQEFDALDLGLTAAQRMRETTGGVTSAVESATARAARRRAQAAGLAPGRPEGTAVTPFTRRGASRIAEYLAATTAKPLRPALFGMTPTLTTLLQGAAGATAPWAEQAWRLRQ